VPESAKYLLIGSTEAYSGKSATVLGMAHQFQERGVDIAYGKPLGTSWEPEQHNKVDADVQFIAQLLKLPEARLRPTLLSLDEKTIQKRILGEDQIDYPKQLSQYLEIPGGNLVLLEGPGNLEEGRLFGVALPQVAQVLDASVLLVARFNSLLVVGSLLSAKERIGDRLMGVLINDIPSERFEEVTTLVKPYLEKQGIPVLGMLPRSSLLRSVSVAELVKQLEAEVLCRPDRLDLMVESLTIGAMNVSSALKYFQKGTNMAVVTGGDRTDLQLAALETSTHCLILTGHIPPSQTVLSRAEDLEIPILSVDLDTLTTVEIVDRAFGQVRLHESIKVQCIRQMMAEYFDIDRLIGELGLQPTAVQS
jgi:uncharacterized protein